MTKTVSARITNETHEKLRERCNKVGCSISDFIEASIEYIFNNYSEFDFGDEESTNETKDCNQSDLTQGH